MIPFNLSPLKHDFDLLEAQGWFSRGQILQLGNLFYFFLATFSKSKIITILCSPVLSTLERNYKTKKRNVTIHCQIKLVVPESNQRPEVMVLNLKFLLT